MRELGRIISGHGRAFWVETKLGLRYLCSTRGKKTGFVCGDWVQIAQTAPEQGVIESLEPRKTLLYRADAWKSKHIAANVSLAVIVFAPVPSPSEEVIDRCLIACEHAKIHPLILLNKMDLPESLEWQARLKRWSQLGYETLALSAKEGGMEGLRARLEGESAVFVGQSGMGKSTLLNALIPKALARTGEISTALDSGRHTTTHATLYQLNEITAIVDSPGLQAFGLTHLSIADLMQAFPEFQPFIGQCRFHNCLHRHEPNCAILAGLEQGEIEKRRMQTYYRVLEELSLSSFKGK